MNTTLQIKIAMRSAAGGEGPAIPVGAPGPVRAAGSTNAKDFRAMMARQRAAEARSRRWKLTGVAFVAGLMTASLVAHRYQRGPVAARAPEAPAVVARPAATTASAAPVAAAAPALAAAIAAAPAAVVEPRPAPAPAPAVASAPVVEPAPVPVTAAASLPSTAAADASGPCDAARHQWLAPVDLCTKVFEAAPSAARALVLAQAYWSRGDAEQTGKWASKALALGTTDPDAWVLVGHAAREAGRDDAAIAAYRRYLRRSPHGWHAAKVRAAVRELRPEPAADEPATPAS